MIEIIAMMMIPCFALAGFVIGCMMASGDVWPTRKWRVKVAQQTKRYGVLEDRYSNLHARYERVRHELNEYQEAYPPLPSEFQTIIQEEPDALSLS